MFGFFSAVVRVCNVLVGVLTATSVFASTLLSILGEYRARPSLVR